MIVKSIHGQNAIDLNLQVFGNIDNVVQWCIDNGVGDINYIPSRPTDFTFNDNLVSDGKTNNYVYVTAIPANYYTTEDGTQNYSTEDGQGGFVPE